MRISVWSYYLQGLSPEQMAETFVEHGWMQTELSSEHGNDLIARGNPDSVGREFRSFATDLGFSCPQAHFDLKADIAHPERSTAYTEQMDNMKRWCDMFIALDVKAGVLHPGGERLREEGWKRDDILSCSTEALNALIEHVSGTSLTLCLENSWFYRDTMHLVDSIASPDLCVCMDTGHLHLEGSHWSEFLAWAGSRLKALHIADNMGTKDDHILPHGKGTIDWKGFGTALGDVGYDGLFNFEVGGESRGKSLEARLDKLEAIRSLAVSILEDR